MHFPRKKARNAWVEKHELDANNNVVARECTVKDVRRYYGEGFTAVHGIVEPEGEHTHTAEEAAHTIREYGQYEGDE